MSNLAALGYNNDSYGIEIRGEDITNASGKIIYSNYVFNSLASKTSYTAFMELANAFALQDMKVGVIVSPSVNLRGIMSIGPDSIIDAKAAYRNALRGRYGDRIKNLAKKGIITLEAVEAFSQDNRNAEDLDKLYESIITDTLSKKDYEEMSLYKVYSTKRAVKLAQAQNFRYENTSLVVPSLFDW